MVADVSVWFRERLRARVPADRRVAWRLLRWIPPQSSPRVAGVAHRRMSTVRRVHQYLPRNDLGDAPPARGSDARRIEETSHRLREVCPRPERNPLLT